MKVVLDTTTFVATFFGGTRRRIIDLWKQGKITLCFSPEILDEYVAVLRHVADLEEQVLRDMVDLFAKGPHVLFTANAPDLSAVRMDPHTQKFIACAVALDAQYVLTMDPRLRSVRQYMNVLVEEPQDFLYEHRQTKASVTERPAREAPERLRVMGHPFLSTKAAI